MKVRDSSLMGNEANDISKSLQSEVWMNS
jgi:hypothetical protein